MCYITEDDLILLILLSCLARQWVLIELSRRSHGNSWKPISFSPSAHHYVILIMSCFVCLETRYPYRT